MQQERVIAEDLKTSLEIEKSRSIELSSLLSREKNHAIDLANESADLQARFSKARDESERDQSRLMTAT